MHTIINGLVSFAHAFVFCFSAYLIPSTWPDHSPPFDCLTPWFCILAMMCGNLTVFIKLIGQFLCSVWQGEQVKMTAPNCWFVIGCGLAAVGYVISLVLLGYVPEKGVLHLNNCTEPIPENLTDLLYAHVIFGAAHVALIVSVILYRICKCSSSSRAKNNTGEEKRNNNSPYNEI